MPPSEFELPEAFEAYRLDDDVLGKGYEATPPAQRARIKTTLAMVQAVHPDCPSLEEHHVVRASTGFGYRLRRRPVPWVMAVLGPGFAHGPRLAAALMPARLAGVGNLVVVCFSAPSSVPPEVLAALELTGVEHALALTGTEALQSCTTLLHTLVTAYGQGCLLVLPGTSDLPEKTWDIPHWKCKPEETSKKETSKTATPSAAPTLELGPGLEGCCFHVDLPLDFFLQRSTTIFMTTRCNPEKDPPHEPFSSD